MSGRYSDRQKREQYQDPQYSGGPSNNYASQGYDGSPLTPGSVGSTLDKVQLGNDEENSKLLDLVDKLRECRVDQFIDLPQVVAVGDQSSGKSSVLEAITGIPFPRDSIQCTRFATQIRLKRDSSLTETTTKVSIHAFNKAKDQQRFDAFEQRLGSDFDFADVFRRATELIFSTNTGNFLSKDILSIERTGPNLPHLTIVDLPGIIHNPTKTQTAADVDAIAELSQFYMKKERTIILAIVGCDAEHARQVIVRRCKEADPSGIRTLGVLTKVDMTLTPAREDAFLDLAANQDPRNKLTLGWHALRNRAHNEMHFTTEQRDAKEREFFNGSRWSQRLDPSQLGVEALRKRLSTQLIRHIANEVFKVQAEIESMLEECRAKLKALGPGLETPEQMRHELLNLCKRSAALTQAATQGMGLNPLGEDFFPRMNDRTKRYSRNLRSRVVTQNEYFGEAMEKVGSSCIIEGSPNDNPDARSNRSNGMPRVVSKRDFIEKEVRPMLDDSPGLELSVDINPLLVYRLFQLYSSNWPELSDKHVSSVHGLCEEFLSEVMSYGWPQRLRGRVWRGFVQQAVDSRYGNAMSELERLKTDRCRYVRTYHSSFDQKYYQQKQAQQGKDEAASSPSNKYEDTLNKMMLHYDHKLPTYINNVITQVIERHLIDGMEEIFQGERVLKLSDEEIRQLMEEDYGTMTERKQIRDQHDILQKGMDICKEISRRPDIGPYDRPEPKFSSISDAPMSPVRSVPVLPRRRVATPPLEFSSTPTRPLSGSSAEMPAPQPPRRPAPQVVSPQSRSTVPDYTPGSYNAAPNSRPSNEQDEEEEMRKAIELSLAENQRQSRIMEDSASVNSQRRPSRRLFGRG
jgi:GTPase SAR1 family protein